MSTEKGLGSPQAPPPQYPGAQANYGFQMTSPAAGAQQNYGHQQTAAPPQNAGYPPSQSYGYPQHNVVITQVQPGYGVQQAPPPDYSTQAWLACLCCFWPTGLVAIMKANEARDAAARGDFASAHAAANSARSMIIISLVVGILSVVVLVVFLGVFFGVVLNNSSPYYP